MSGHEPTPVVHVISDAGPHQYFRTLIEDGGADRRALAVGCVGPAGALQDDMAALGVETFALGARSRAAFPLAAGRLGRLLRARRVQVVQTHLVDGCLVGLAGARLARVPVSVMTAHHSHELPFHGRRLRWSERICAGWLADHIIAPSRKVADTLVAYTGIPAGKVDVIHHGFDLSRLDSTRVSGGRVRRELGLDGSLVFGAVGRLYRLKNQSALVEAFAAVLDDVPEARLLIVGPGDPAPLAALAADLGIADRVVLSPARSDVPAVLAAIDAFVHPAIAESFGMVIIEAMAMARPVLSTPVGIAPEVVSNATGVLAASPSAPDLEFALRALIARREDWPRMGAIGRARVSGFTATSMTQRHEELYARLLRARTRAERRDSLSRGTST